MHKKVYVNFTCLWQFNQFQNYDIVELLHHRMRWFTIFAECSWYNLKMVNNIPTIKANNSMQKNWCLKLIVQMHFPCFFWSSFFYQFVYHQTFIKSHYVTFSFFCISFLYQKCNETTSLSLEMECTNSLKIFKTASDLRSSEISTLLKNLKI